jgi:hypothetical protein
MWFSLFNRLMSFITLITFAAAQSIHYPLMYGDSSILDGASQACIDTFNSNVSCPQAIGHLYADPFPNFNKGVLDALSTTQCIESLRSLHKFAGVQMWV